MAPTSTLVRALSAAIALLLASNACGARPPMSAASTPATTSTSPDVVGSLRMHAFTSRVFNNTRMLRVLLPAGYDDERHQSDRYPVLYMNDGQNLFDRNTAVFNRMEWQFDETVRTLSQAGDVPPLIVVGIDNAGRQERFSEYFPYVDEYLRPPQPDTQGMRYPEFLVDEVLPFISTRYRTRPDPAAVGLGGSSAGGLAAIYAVISRPGVFGRLLIESPSLYVDDAHILRDARAATSWPGRIYLGVGTNERGAPACRPDDPNEPELVRDVRRFEEVVRAAGVDEARIRVLVTPCARHDEAAWAGRLPTALRFLFAERT